MSLSQQQLRRIYNACSEPKEPSIDDGLLGETEPKADIEARELVKILRLKADFDRGMSPLHEPIKEALGGFTSDGGLLISVGYMKPYLISLDWKALCNRVGVDPKAPKKTL